MKRSDVVKTLQKYYGPGCQVWMDGPRRFGSGLWEAGVPLPNGTLFEIIATGETLEQLNERIITRFITY